MLYVDVDKENRYRLNRGVQTWHRNQMMKERCVFAIEVVLAIAVIPGIWYRYVYRQLYRQGQTQACLQAEVQGWLLISAPTL